MVEYTGPIQHKRATSADWSISTVPLREGEMGVDLDSGWVKFGDGATLFPSLPWAVTPGDPGPQGERGPAGQDGANVLPTSTAIAEGLTNPGPAQDALNAATIAAVSTRTPGFFNGPWSKFLARAATRDTKPVLVLLCGTSQVEGNASTEWPHMLNKVLQATFPLTSGEVSPPLRTMRQYIDAGAPALTPGVQVINAGVSGSFAGNILPGNYGDTALALAPYTALYIIDTGTNDKQTGVTPEAFLAGLKSEMDYVLAAAGPSTKVYVHGNDRLFYNPATVSPRPWDDYRAQKQILVNESPSDRLLVDLSEVLRGVGVGLDMTDPLGLIQTDGLGVHYSDSGNLFYFEAICNALQVPRSGGSGSASVGRWVMSYSDAFTGADVTDINGRTFDNTLGGATAATWINTAVGSVAMTGGRMVKGATAGNWFVGRAAATDMEKVEFTLGALPSAGSNPNLLPTFCRATATAGTLNGLTLSINPAGGMVLNERTAAGSTAIIPTSSVAAGDVIALERKGLDIRLLKNGAAVGTATISTENASNRVFGFSGASTSVGWWIDDVKVYTWEVAA